MGVIELGQNPQLKGPKEKRCSSRPVVRTEGSKPVTPPPAAPTMEVLSPLPSSFPAPVEITHATNATISAASSIAGDSLTIPAIAVETAPATRHLIEEAPSYPLFY